MIDFAEKSREKSRRKCFAEKFLLFLAVSPRNRQFTICLFLPEARNLFCFFLYVDCICCVYPLDEAIALSANNVFTLQLASNTLYLGTKWFK